MGVAHGVGLVGRGGDIIIDAVGLAAEILSGGVDDTEGGAVFRADIDRILRSEAKVVVTHFKHFLKQCGRRVVGGQIRVVDKVAEQI